MDDIKRAMKLASMAVIIAGAFFVVVMIVYCIQVVWSKISACAKKTKEYLQNKQDFEVYKADVLHWDMAKREKALRCRECAYRKKYMNEEASHDAERGNVLVCRQHAHQDNCSQGISGIYHSNRGPETAWDR